MLAELLYDNSRTSIILHLLWWQVYWCFTMNASQVIVFPQTDNGEQIEYTRLVSTFKIIFMFSKYSFTMQNLYSFRGDLWKPFNLSKMVLLVRELCHSVWTMVYSWKWLQIICWMRIRSYHHYEVEVSYISWMLRCSFTFVVHILSNLLKKDTELKHKRSMIVQETTMWKMMDII